ncbi:alpha/beta hydrolase [Paraglaciecola aquimarina]|uniref:Alpha/beta hydrolase n=1 Tax=Paraglaciecola algarum TaxID=3050085 RepID=A0ABS9D9G6_9ALTE|nr:alpha/beta hydrolase [Paraglaciecola sp. G1-23]MCF2949595.1 alpha/beta hydrolase [Paraglaciecola sp. G1-23]
MIDDSYTVFERFQRYQQKYPEISLPKLRFNAQQSILFDIPYRKVGKRTLHLDLFLPDANNLKPHTIILVHGGGWRSGNKSHMYLLANTLSKKGYQVVIPEYRLSVEALYPAGLEDLNHGIDWLRSQGSKFGLSSDKLVLVGGSSGGQMAALIANTADKTLFKKGIEQKNTQVQALVVLDGLLDFEHPLALKYETKKGRDAAASLWFGNTYEEAPEIWRQASAVNHINQNSPATLVISSGQMRFTAGKDKVLSELSRHNISNQYIQLNDVMHTFWLFEPYLSIVGQKMVKFLEN